MKALDSLTVADAASWAEWLDKNGDDSAGVILTLAKKNTTSPTSLTQDEAVQEALCHGWINGHTRSLDAKTYAQRFTPRAGGKSSSHKSLWSKRNVDFVARLTRQGRMKPSGLRAVAEAQADGRWDRAYSGSADDGEMLDLLERIHQSERATRVWDEQLGKGEKSRVYFRLVGLRTAAGRERFISRYVEGLESGGIGATAKTTTMTTTKTMAEGSAKKRRRSVNHGYDGEDDGLVNPAAKTVQTRSGRRIRPPLQ